MVRPFPLESRLRAILTLRMLLALLFLLDLLFLLANVAPRSHDHEFLTDTTAAEITDEDITILDRANAGSLLGLLHGIAAALARRLAIVHVFVVEGPQEFAYARL